MVNLNFPEKLILIIIIFVLFSINFKFIVPVHAKESVLLTRPLDKYYSIIDRGFRKKIENLFNIEIQIPNTLKIIAASKEETIDRSLEYFDSEMKELLDALSNENKKKKHKPPRNTTTEDKKNNQNIIKKPDTKKVDSITLPKELKKTINDSIRDAQLSTESENKIDKSKPAKNVIILNKEPLNQNSPSIIRLFVFIFIIMLLIVLFFIIQLFKNIQPQKFIQNLKLSITQLLKFIFIQLNTIKISSKNSCMIVSRNFEKIPYSEKKDFSIPLTTFFKNLKFKVTVAKDLKTVEETLNHYVPNVVCVDCQFEVNICSVIQKMLPDISYFSDVIILFYNATDSIDSFHLENEAKLARTFYFGTSFTLKEVKEVINSLPGEKMKTQNDIKKDTTKYKSLIGKISNYSKSYKLSTSLDDLSMDQSGLKELTTVDDIYKFIEATGFPVIIQPSYYQSGASMSVVSNRDELENFLSLVGEVSKKYPVVISEN